MDVKVSVIMPVYNSEKYLRIAVDSVLSQNFDGFELILIDDGSTDKSGVICDWYAKTDNRVRVIHKKNGGICSARNVGLKIATGEYIGFCDNDDKYLPGLLQDNYTLAKQNDADIVRFKRQRIKTNDKGKREVDSNFIPSGVHLFVGEEINRNYPCIRRSGFAVWSALYRRELVVSNHLHFIVKAKAGYEDHIFNMQIYRHCNRIVLNSKVYYSWIRREGHSTTDKFNMNIVDTLLYCVKQERETYVMRRVDDYAKGYWYNILLYHLYFVFWYMNRDCCRLSMWSKIRILIRIRSNKYFSRDLTEDCAGYITDTNSLGKMIVKYFYQRRFIALYISLKIRNQEY